jgi:uncharacterized protein
MRRRSSVRAFVVLCGLLSVWTPSILRSSPQSASPPQETKSGPLDQYKPRGYVSDFAGIIDAQSQAKLEALSKKLDQEKSAQLAIVTVEKLNGMPIKDFATQLFNRWGIGDKETNRGVLILLSKDDHQYRVATGLGLELILTDEKCAALGKEMVPQLRKGEYGAALLRLANRIADEIQHQVAAR